MWRYLRAFFVALRMTLRGEKPQRPYAKVHHWLDPLSSKVQAVYHSSKQHKVDGKTIKVQLDGRESSLQMILDGINFHVNEEYPYMLAHPTHHTLNAIYASNLNDQYGITRLLEHESVKGSPLRPSLEQLLQHLETIPTQDSAESRPIPPKS